MSRYVKTVVAADGSGGGGSDVGLTAAQACQYACKAVCDMFCTNLICPECRPYYNTLPTPTVNEWVVICHCACWTNCYGQNLVWCLDTNKYSGFKWCYCGVNIRGCCGWYATMGMAAKGVDCFCCCNNAYTQSCNRFGTPPCMCCNACWQYWNACAIQELCQRCCQSQCDGNFNFGWAIFPMWQSSQSNQERVCGQIGYCIWMPYGNYDKMQWRGGCEVYIGTNGHCQMYMTWSCNEACYGTTNYLDRWCLCFHHGYGFKSLACGIVSTNNCWNGKTDDGLNLCKGVTPSWTMWGIPCCYPMNIGSFSGGTGLTCHGSFPTWDKNVDWVESTS
jgi:hypothetical protein